MDRDYHHQATLEECWKFTNVFRDKCQKTMMLVEHNFVDKISKISEACESIQTFLSIEIQNWLKPVGMNSEESRDAFKQLIQQFYLQLTFDHSSCSERLIDKEQSLAYKGLVKACLVQTAGKIFSLKT